MKKIFFSTLFLFAISNVTFAQEKKEKVRIRIEQEVDGKTILSVELETTEDYKYMMEQAFEQHGFQC